jgi:ComF family protein
MRPWSWVRGASLARLRRFTAAAVGVGWRSAAQRSCDASLNLLLPPHCAYCHEDMPWPVDRALVCTECRELVAPRLGATCRQCGATIPAAAAGEVNCPRCHGRRWHFDAVYPLGMYRDELRHAVLRMKRPAEEPLSMALGRLLAARVAPRLAEARIEAVVPVPMHWTRRMARGTNSPELLAVPLAAALGVRVERDLLVRQRRTQPHGSLSRRKRHHNIKGALAVRRRYHLDAARILLVDDILTTGVTCNEAARVLRQAGAEFVTVAVIARAEGRG